MMDDVAVIGLGCRFPGADNADEFWRVLVNGENHLVDIPPDRWNNEKYYSDKKDEPGKHYVTKAGFISGNHGWDNKLFGVSDSEAVRVDPQQRLVLECTHMAFEDAGITRQEIQGTQTGVYIGVMNDDYKGLSSFDHEGDTNYSATGMSTTIISSRVSYTYDLRGPCMVVDTACSSSMVCIHLGCQAIKSGDCDMAIAGGVSSILSPDMFITLCKAGMLSPSGNCQTFCDTADGYARGEGCGIVILKSFKKAVECGNKIWGIIQTGTNQDGHTVQPITAPSSMQQELLLTKLYSHHKMDPRELQYIEAHGTGTKVGDPTETNALGKFIQSYKTKNFEQNVSTNTKDDTSEKLSQLSSNQMEKSSIMIGSVKTNIGHLESAAGVASLIKVLLMMANEKIVPSLHVKQDKSNVNKDLNLIKYNFDIPVCVTHWKTNKSGNRIACVNCFGFGGSNSHAIVMQKPTGVQNNSAPQSAPFKDSSIYIICVSAPSAKLFHSSLENLSKDLIADRYNLDDICFTSVYHRDRFVTRSFVFGRTLTEILQNIQVKMQHVEKIAQNKERNVVFVFCGVGTTWKGMGQEMMKTQSVFKTAILNIDKILYPYTNWSIAEKLSSDSDYTDPLLQHIAIFCIQIALFETWKYFGVQPDVIIGQSVGEVASAYASGALSLKDAVKVIYFRSCVLSKQTGGKMMVVRNISHDDIDSLCKSVDNRATIAVYNSDLSFTLSGDSDAIDELQIQLENKRKLEADIIITPLTVQCAYHSHHMDSCVEAIKNQIGNLPERKRLLRHISTVTGKLACESDFQSGKYWADNIRKSVLFANAVRLATKEDALNVFVEIGPKPVLRAHLKSIFSNSVDTNSLMSMNVHQESSCLYSSLCTLFEYGTELNWANIMPNEGKTVPVPRYVFDRKQQLHLPYEKQVMLFKGKIKHGNTHMYVKESVGGNAHFLIQIDQETTPFVYDHFMFNSTLVPGATWVEAAFEVGQRIDLLNALEIDVSTVFVNTLLPKSETSYLLQVKLEKLQQTGHSFKISNDEKVICHGKIVPRGKLETYKIDIQRLRSRMPVHKNQQESYECLHRLNFRYENSMRIIQQSWSSQTECVVEMKLPEIVQMQRKSTNIHPAIVDAIFQTFGILSSSETFSGEPTLPYRVGSFILNRPPQTHMFAYSHLKNASIDENYYNSVLLTPDGQTIAEVRNFCTKSITSSTDKINDIFYELTWQVKSVSSHVLMDSTKKVIIIGSDKFIHEYRKTCDANVTYIGLSESLASNLHMSEIAETLCIVFAPVFHIDEIGNDSRCIYLKVKQNCLQLQNLFTFLAQLRVSVPLLVVTENVVGIPSLGVSSSNVIGAELWGMVRSALHEGTHSDIRLIDMKLTKENLLLLKTAIEKCQDSFNEFDECVFHCGRIYASELVEKLDERQHEVKEVNPSSEDDVELVSTSPCELIHPVFIQARKNKIHHREKHMYSVNLEQICLQDTALFPCSIDFDEDIAIKNENGEFKMMCVEGRGFIEDHYIHNSSSKEKTTDVVFCFPVEVTSQVQVPKHCVFPTNQCPLYTPGLISVGIIMKNIYNICKHSSRILVLAGRASRLQETVIKAIFSEHSGLQLTISQKEDVTNKKDIQDIDTVVILEHFCRDDFVTLKQAFLAMTRVVSVTSVLSTRMKHWIEHNHNGVSVSILRTSDFFTSNALLKAVPKVFKMLKHIGTDAMKHHNEHRCLAAKEINFLALPYPVLDMPRSSKSVNSIPLRLSLGSVFRKNSCYILVGGLTGLGWETLKMMVEQGAPIIATMSRRKPDKNKENELLQLQNDYACKIIPLEVDITDFQQVKMAIDNILTTQRCHIRGIFHGGGLTRDKLLKDTTETDLDEVLLPKVQGTLNLHKATLDIHLDFFTMHSSIVSIFGNEGQCNYAAGNAFQDAVAHYRRSIGLCGQSINWGPLAVGMAAENSHVEKILKSKGFHFLSTGEIRLSFQHSLVISSPQLMLCRLDWKKVLRNPAMKIGQRKFAGFVKKHTAPAKSSHDNAVIDFEHFKKLDANMKRMLISEIVKQKLSDHFLVDEKTLDMNTTIVQLGIESLRAMSFVNEISDSTNVNIPMASLFSDDTTVASITAFILAHIQTNVFDHHGQEVVEDHILTEHLKGSITFMQKELLEEFIQNPFSRYHTRQIDFEISGMTMCKNDWSVVLHHLIHMNPELRRIYRHNKGTGEFTSILLDSNDVKLQITETSFDSLCGENATDLRDTIRLDIREEIPLRVLIAINNDVTRVRMFVHSVALELSGIGMLFQEFANTAKALARNEPLPTKDITVDHASAIRRVLSQQMVPLKAFWHEQLSSEITPFTFSDNIDAELDETFWREIYVPIPKDLIGNIIKMLNTEGLTMYQFIVCSYMVLLHEKTRKTLIPLLTTVDMISHVPQLKPYITRSIKDIPIVGDMQNIGHVSEYLKKSSIKLNSMTEKSAYPYELIEKEMKGQSLKKHIGRHRVVLDDMTSINEVIRDGSVSVKLGNIFHKRYVYETSLYIMHDTKLNSVTLQFGYNERALKSITPTLMLPRLIELMKRFTESPRENIHNILEMNLIADYKTSRNTTNQRSVTPVWRATMSQSSPVINSGAHNDSSCSQINIHPLANCSELTVQVVVWQDKFSKQISQGWEHDVHLQIVKEMYRLYDDKTKIMIMWGNGKKLRKIYSDFISEVSVKKLKGMVYICTKTFEREYIFKARSSATAVMWMQKLEEACKEVLNNSGSFVCHL